MNTKSITDNCVEEILAHCEEELDDVWREIGESGCSDDSWSRLQRALTRYNEALAARPLPLTVCPQRPPRLTLSR